MALATPDPGRSCHRRDRRGSGGRGAFALGVLVALLGWPAAAAEKPVTTFMGVGVTPYPVVYLVQKDVNVRAKPDTKSEKVGSLQNGIRINVVAKASGGWVALRDGGKDLGFVHDSALLPLIDGQLLSEIKGNLQVKNGPACAYRIRFEGKSPVEGQLFEIADYDVAWDCKLEGRALAFRTPMFITEASYQLNQKRIFQINMDLLDLFGGIDEILSTVVLYDQDKRQVQFEAVTIEKYGHAPASKTAPAKSVAEAIEGAARIAVSAWNKQAWTDLAKAVQ